MIKRLSLLRRKENVGFDEFAAHWAGPHARIATAMDGIAKYTQNRVRRVIAARQDAQGTFMVDGVVELCFVDQAAMDLAGTTETVKTLLPQDELRFLSGITLTLPVTEGSTGPDTGLTKVMLLASRGDAQGQGFEDAVTDLVQRLPVVRRTVVDRIRHSYHRPTLWHEPVDLDMVVSLWLSPEDLPDFERAASASLETAAGVIGRASLLAIDPLHIV